MALWAIEDMAHAMDAELVYQGEHPPESINDISIDSRSLNAGDAFFAISGVAMDGHRFVIAAEKAGAGVAIVEEAKLDDLKDCTLPLLVVEDTLNALEDLARAARSRTSAKLVAITGSVGKTTTKEMMRHVLSGFGTVHASPASFNNHWGVPLTLARLPQDCDFGVFEIGMNHHGEITPLVDMVQPDVAVITNVAAAHLGAFKDLRDIAKAKAEILTGVAENATAILNRDDAQFEFLRNQAESNGIKTIRSFGRDGNANAYLEKYVANEVGACISGKLSDEPIAVKIGMPGEHIAMNSMAALLVVEALGLDLTPAALRFAELEPEKGRGQCHHLNINGHKVLLIDESYNANPASMRAAISNLATCEPNGMGRRIAILGDMLELGEQSQLHHEALLEPLETARVDLVHLVGDEMKALYNVLSPSKQGQWAASVDEILTNIVKNVSDGDVMMVKASNSLKFAYLVESLRADYGNKN